MEVENKIVRYKGQKYKKVFECTDSINACDMCCFCGIDDNGLSKCDMPIYDGFYGCGEGKFHWEKEEKKGVMVSIKNQVIKDDKLNLFFDFYSEYYLRFYNFFIQIPFKKVEWGYDNENWFDGNTFNKNIFGRDKDNKDMRNSFWRKVFGDFEKSNGFVFSSREKGFLIKDLGGLYKQVETNRNDEFKPANYRKVKELKRNLYFSLIRPKINQKFYETIEKMTEEEKKNEHEIKKIYEEISSEFNKEYYDICNNFVKNDDKSQEEIRKEIETKFPLPYKESKNKKKCFFELDNKLFGIEETKEKDNIYIRKILFSENFGLLKEFINKKCELKIVEETKRINACFEEEKQKEYEVKRMEEKFKCRASKDIEFFKKFINKGHYRHYFTVPLKEDIKKLKRVKLSRRNGVWAFDYIYEKDNKECSERVEDKYCYIDIGGKNTLAYVIDGERPVLISGEKFNDYIKKYDKQKTDMQVKTAKTYKVEEVYPKSLQKIDNKWNNRIELITNDIKNLFINHILESGVTNVVYGWNEHIKEEKKKKKKEETEEKTEEVKKEEVKSKETKEKKKEEVKSKKAKKGLYLFRVTPHKKLMKLIESKLKLYGIKVESINESYTSKVDALMKESIPEGFVKGVGFDKEGNEKRTNRDTYISEYEIDGKRVELNADINGALNIGRKYMKSKKNDKDVVDCQDINDLLNPRIIYDLQEELKKYRKK